MNAQSRAKRSSFYALLGAAAITISCGPIWADTIYSIDTGNSAISGYTGPYAKVEVMLTSSTTAKITFSSLINSGKIFLMGGASAADVNVNAASWTIDNFSASNSGIGFTPGPLSDDRPKNGEKNISEFGTFNQPVTSFDGFTHSSDTISFTLTNTGGTWASDAAVLKANEKGYEVGAHIFVTEVHSPANASNGALSTGYGVGSPIPVPLPAAGPLGLGLFGCVLGVGYLRRRESLE